MQETEFSATETLLIRCFGVVAIVFTLGLIFAPETFWDNFMKIYVWDPIVKDAGETGDAGYTPVNTALYIFTMVAAVIVLQAWFRRWKLPTNDHMLWALMAWVCVAPLLRVMEDADFFSAGIDLLFISPIIHLHLAIWLIVSAIIGQISKRDSIQMMSLIMVAYIVFSGMIISPSIHDHEMGTTWVMLGTFGGIIAIVVSIHNTWDWHQIPRAMLALAMGIITMGIGYLAQLASTPWAQDLGHMPKDNPVFWPILVVVVCPLLITWLVWRKGIEDLSMLRLTGNEVGVIPDNMTLNEWESEDRSEHAVEMLSNRGILATPMVAGILFGQLCDGLATMVGIDWFGYNEKHTVSLKVIEIGDSLGILGEGAWLFFLLKATLAGTIIWLFSQMRIEMRQQHLRVLIVLAVMVVGMAPGLRDILRLILGV
ncbi:MAG: DUF63 family protein [Candidatus Poseidoniaceae archaeon]|jgi:uncharacterized membrane protein|nr:DUF63 family protein [Candidatus Poseidoniaceae archaeon]